MPSSPDSANAALSAPVNDSSNSRKKNVKPSVSPFVKGLGGSMGGLMEACFLQPIDVIKTRMQLDNVGKYKGIFDCGKQISVKEGVPALWKGLFPFSTHLTLKYALRYSTNATFQGLLRDKNTGHLSESRRLLAGFGAGVTEALAIVTPFEVIKIRLQQQVGSTISTTVAAGAAVTYKGPVDAAIKIVQLEGPMGLWSGALPTVMRNGTNQMCMFWAKANLDRLLWNKHDNDGRTLAPWQSMVSGFCAAVLGPVATGPFDVVKTRLMAQLKGGGELRYKGFVHALVTIPREEGIRALYKGLLPRLMRIPPGQAITWAVADQVIGMFERSNHAMNQEKDVNLESESKRYL